MTGELESVRAQLGGSAALWAGAVSHDEDGWTAFSGARSVDYNVALCTGDGPALDAAVERIVAAGVPAIAMVTGAALGEVQRLVARSWVCVGATPVMVRALDAPVPSGAAVDPLIRTLDGAELNAARELVARVFEVGPQLASLALPAPGSVPGIVHEIWGAHDGDGRLRSCLALVRVEDSVAVWSMATDADSRGRGHGRRVLEAALARAVAGGARRSLLYASPDGEPFYRRLGFAELERWQMWSRPRWVLGRA